MVSRSGGESNCEEYEVEELLDVRTVYDETEYLIKWKGHSP